MALPGRLAERGGNGTGLCGIGLALADLGSLSLSDLPSLFLYDSESSCSLKLSDLSLMRNGAALTGERGRGETRLAFGMGADNGGTMCLAAETGVLGRSGWSEFCGRAE